MDLKSFIEEHVKQIQPLEKASNLAWWNLATTGDGQYAKEFEQANIAIRKIYSSSEDYQNLVSLQSEDPLLMRQRTLLLHKYRENQIPAEKIEEIVKLETEIESIYTTFRPILDGTPLSNNQIKAILSENNDSRKREEAWVASKIIGEQVEKKILKLIELRNACAKSCGYDNFYTMRLDLQELNENKLFALLEELDKLTEPHWQRYKEGLDDSLCKRFNILKDELMPWHYQDPFFQEAPKVIKDLDRFYQDKDIVAISQKFYSEIGLPVDDILHRSDLLERENKNQHAFCICIDRAQDVRILCNIRSNEYWMATQLHELGHGVYDKYINQSLPYLLRTYAHVNTTEAIAMLFGRFSKCVHFLRHYCNIPSEALTQLKKPAQNQLSATLLVFVRWAMVMIYFERALYQQPNINLNELWWDLVVRYQWLNRIPNRDKPDWAAKLHLACAPVYYQNYVLGEMTASQLLHFLNQGLAQREEQFIFSKFVGNTLVSKLFSLGAIYPWDLTVKHATGEMLSPKYFADDISQV